MKSTSYTAEYCHLYDLLCIECIVSVETRPLFSFKSFYIKRASNCESAPIFSIMLAAVQLQGIKTSV